jgi:hypothetical protein
MIRSIGLATLLAFGCSGTSSNVPQNNVCVSRCETKGVTCGIDDRTVLARCEPLCAAKPTDVQLTCIDGLACADLLQSSMPCGLSVGPLDAGAPDL